VVLSEEAVLQRCLRSVHKVSLKPRQPLFVVYAPMSRYLPYSNRIQIGRSSENKTGTAQLTFAAHRMERTANTHFQH